MTSSYNDRVRWRDNPNAVELGFDYYLGLIERRLKGDDVSLVQGLRNFFRDELSINLRETQARGLMHRDSSVFSDYVQSIMETDFLPNLAFWEAVGLDRFLAWKDEFVRARNLEAIDLVIEAPDSETEFSGTKPPGPPPRQEVRVFRVVRDSALSRFVKSLYSYQCQICRFTFTLSGGRRYAETHHIMPLGGQHRGIDKETNMIVLCPNHHSLMDYGAIGIHPDEMTVVSINRGHEDSQERLQLSNHPIGKEFLEYHMENIFNKV